MSLKKDMQKMRWRIVIALLLCLCVVPVMGQKAEAAKTCPSVISFPGKTSSKVNLRKKAGTNYKSYGMLSKNQSVTILGEVTNKGVKWYKCKAKINGKNKTGYVSASYVKRTFPVKGTVNSKVTSSLNVRKKQKTSSKSLGAVAKGTEVTVKSITKKSSTYWYKISVKINGKNVTGYVSGKYISVGTASTTTENTTAENGQAGYVNEKVTTTLRVRKKASTSGKVLMYIPTYTEVTVLGTTGDWYKITVTYGGKTVTGYVAKEYITIGTKPEEQTTTEENQDSIANEAYETLLQSFPDSYKTYLETLHAAYPNWKFVAVDTGLDWNTVISNESVVGRNVIQSNYPKGGTTLAPFSYLSTASGAYDWSTDKYTVKDGTNWYSANSSVIAYYMDPRNFLNDTDIFQFETLSYDASQSETVVQSILSNTFMNGNYSVVDSATGATASGSYSQAFMDAGKTAQVNPYFLATRVKQEVGVNGSNATSGTYKGYEGLYNFYNIGANDGTNAVANGLLWASGGTAKATTYGRPWTTPYKSIVGGAKYIAANYTSVGQNTLYFQKFNVNPSDAKYLYLHQYMTNVQAPYSEGRTTRTAYNSLGILSNTMIFYIPVYSNMPTSACALPASAGNPNPFLSDISVYSGSTKLSMSSTFVKPTSTGTLSNSTYSVVVSKSVAQVTVAGSVISSKTTLSGTGTVNLGNPGETTTVVVSGIAQNGARQDYTINITRNTK